MMDSMPLVFDVSSDEDGWRETRGGGEGAVSDNDYDWLSAVLQETEKVKEIVESDDVVLVSVDVKPTVKKMDVDDDDGDDDDCVVLDGDPDKPVAINNNGEGDSDDLLVVGEKGQIACRDYPHSRHLCANFPFAFTPHERHCHQCHCYVCDTLAPCVKWGDGTSCIDHCHATDKNEFWKLERRNFKQGDKAPRSVHKLPDSYVSMRPQQTSQYPPVTQLQLNSLALLPDTSVAMRPDQTNLCPPVMQLQPNSLVQNQIYGPATLRACSNATNFGIPNITNQGRSQQPVHVLSRNRFQPHLVSQQLLSTRNNIVQKDRRHNSGHLLPQNVNSHAIFKRAGSSGVSLATNQSGYSSSNNNFLAQYSRNPSHVVASNDTNPSSWQGFPNRMTSNPNAYLTPSLQNSGSSFVDSVPSQPRVSSHPNMGSVFVNSVPSQPRLSMGSVVVNSVASQPRVSLQPNIGSSFDNSFPQASSQLNMGCNFENSVPSQPQVSSQPHTVSSFVNKEPSQTQVYSQPIPAMQDGLQQVNETQSALDPRFSDINTSWISPTGQSNQQPLADNSQIQSAGPAYHPPVTTEFDPQILVNTIPGSLDFQFDNWLLANQSVFGAIEVSEPYGLNLYSPEPPPVDAGFLSNF